MPVEPVFFHKGLFYDRISSLQEPGSLKSAENILFDREGIQGMRSPYAGVNSTAVGAIHSMKAWRDKIFIADTTHLRGNAGIGDFTDLYGSFANAIWQFRTYKEFAGGSNGTDFILVDEDMNVYPAQVEAPTSAATLADSTTAGNPDGNYIGYVSYFITWPNGHTYETGLSPASSEVTVSTNKITWTNIPLCPYAAYYGTAPTIYRNLYRGPGATGTLTELYYVATISDNTTQTYTDDIADITLQVGYISTVDDYLPMIVPKYFEFNYGRMFAIHPTYTNRLYWSEVAIGDTAISNEILFPISYLADNWDDLRVPGFDHVDPQGLVNHGSYLFIPLKHTWIRKQGNDPNTWAYRKTYATRGIGAPHTIDRLPQGIIGVTNPEYGEPCLAIFNGNTSEPVASPKLDYLFKTDINLDYIAYCRGRRVGNKYMLLYPSNDATTTPDKMIVLDMSRGQDVRVSHWTDLAGNCLDTDSQSTKFYVGGSDGIVREPSISGSADVLIETHDLVGGDPKLSNEQKTWNTLKYALDTDGDNVTLEVYVDNIIQTWPDDTTSKTITGTSEITQIINSFPQNCKGKKMRLKLTGSAMTTFELYSPWTLEFTA